MGCWGRREGPSRFSVGAVKPVLDIFTPGRTRALVRLGPQRSQERKKLPVGLTESPLRTLKDAIYYPAQHESYGERSGFYLTDIDSRS